MGKVQLACAPMINHWWQVPLYVTARGLTTSPIPDGHRTFQIDFDFLDHRLLVWTSDGQARDLRLRSCPVAEFYGEVMGALREEAAFYAYPEPDGFGGHPVRPKEAFYRDQMREFILPYDAVRASDDPDAALLDFLQSSYEAAAVCGGWDRQELEKSYPAPGKPIAAEQAPTFPEHRADDPSAGT